MVGSSGQKAGSQKQSKKMMMLSPSSHKKITSTGFAPLYTCLYEYGWISMQYAKSFFFLSLSLSLSLQVVFVVHYFKKRPMIPYSPSDVGTSNTDEASAHINHAMETGDKYIFTQVHQALF